jgi:hypothetical protein
MGMEVFSKPNMVVTQRLGHQDFNGLPQKFLAPIAKDLLSPGINKDNFPFLTYHDYGIGCGFYGLLKYSSFVLLHILAPRQSFLTKGVLLSNTGGVASRFQSGD